MVSMSRIPILLFTAVSLPAADIAPGFWVGGWGEAFARGSVHEAGNPLHDAERNVGDTDRSIDFAADAALIGDYTVDRFHLRVDTVISDKPQFANPDSTVLLEQAFIDFRQTEQVTWRAGRFRTTWLGWEGFHTAELWRVNHSAAWDWNVQNHSLKPNKPFLSDGVGLLTSTSDDRFHAEFYVVDDVLGDGDDTRGTDKASGASFWTRVPDIGRVELGVCYDPRSTNSGVGNGDSHAFAVDVNADLTAFRDQGWFFAAEGQFHNHPSLTINDVRYGNDLVLLAMANYAFTPTVSSTVMVDWVERGFAAPDNRVLETAVAVLTRPHPQVRFNAEVFYWAEQADRADAYGVSGVVNVALP